MAQAHPCDPSVYYDRETWNRFLEVAHQHETPALVMDLDRVATAYDELHAAFGRFARIYYAHKANPAPEITALLRDRGSCFDIASPPELRQVLAFGVDPSRVSVGTTIKKERDIREYYESGVRIFATDSEEDLMKLARGAPGAYVYVRLLAEKGTAAEWPLSRKFGCECAMATGLLIRAKELGLRPYGVSFHVGSQQRDIGSWEPAINDVAAIFRELSEKHDIHLKMVNLGGGWPGHYLNYVSPIAEYASRIEGFLKRAFGEDNFPIVMIEPGRSLVSDAGIVVTEVMNVARKSLAKEADKWVFLDCGKYCGIYEADDTGIKYPLWVEGSKSSELEGVVLAGPTCDSTDIMYEKFQYKLPVDLHSGDKIYFMNAGAYTYSTSTVAFNGFEPLKCYFTGNAILPSPSGLAALELMLESVTDNSPSSLPQESTNSLAIQMVPEPIMIVE